MKIASLLGPAALERRSMPKDFCIFLTLSPMGSYRTDLLVHPTSVIRKNRYGS